MKHWTPHKFVKSTTLSGPTSIAQVVQQMTAPLFQGKNALWAQLRLHWDEIVGSDWAAQTLPLRITFPTDRQPRGLLHLAIWGENLLARTYEASYICERVNQYVGFGAVHTIKWRCVEPPSAVQLDSLLALPLRVLDSSDCQWIQDHTQKLSGDLQEACQALGESLLKASPQRRSYVTAS